MEVEDHSVVVEVRVVGLVSTSAHWVRSKVKVKVKCRLKVNRCICRSGTGSR